MDPLVPVNTTERRVEIAMKRLNLAPGTSTVGGARRLIHGALPALVVAAVIAAGCSSSTSSNDAAAPTDTGSTAELQPRPAMVVGPEGELAEQWGVEVVALRNTAAGYMLDFRYKVLDPDKAAPLFERANKPFVIHHDSGARMEVHNPAKTGPLRPTNLPEAGRIYFIFFSNARGVVQPGDLVTVEIGEFSADVIVE